MIKGIDISHWNGSIDFNKVRASGIEFVIIKAGGHEGRFYSDPNFLDNYWKALGAGLYVGAYYFAGKNFRGIEKGIEDAKHFIELLSGKRFEYPVYLDIEAQENRYKDGITDAAIAFCMTMEKAGYYVGIYASDISGFKDKLIHDRIEPYAHWVARYGKAPEICKSYGIWQYSSKGSVNGISGSVDLDYSYEDYPEIMKKTGLNNVPKSEQSHKNKEVKKTKKKEGKKDGI